MSQSATSKHARKHHMPIDWPRFVKLVNASRRVLLTSHLRPDCDALGSELGMCGILEALGKEARIVNADAPPTHLKFIDPASRIQVLGVDTTAEEFADVDLIIVLDTSAWAQLGEMGDVIRASGAQKIVLDHHVSADDLGAHEFKDSQAEATGRLVAEAADHLGVKLDSRIATPLFAALATDTGWFRFSSVKHDTFAVAAKLVEAGARPAEIYRELYEHDTLARVHLRGRILSHAQVELEGRLIWSQAKSEDFQLTGSQRSDTEDVINMMLAVGGSEVAILFVEIAPDQVKVSLRSRSKVDCSQLAEHFAGGGHRAAAGAMLFKSLSESKNAVLDVVREAMR